MTVTAIAAEGLLRTFVDADVFEAADIHVAQRLTALVGEADERVALAIALVVRAVRGGSVCVDLREAPAQIGIAGPSVARCRRLAGRSAGEPTARLAPVLRLLGELLYLDRYWLEEEQVCADLLALSGGQAAGDLPGYKRLFPEGYDEQRKAAEIALSVGDRVDGRTGNRQDHHGRATAGAAGGAVRGRRPTAPRIALAAPTGKAAARLAEAVAAEVENLEAVDASRLAGLRATTLHRLLGSRPDTSVRFKHNRGNRLPHDVIVVDETSMVSLTMMSRLLEAVRPDTRLILVGDPDQLASVEAAPYWRIWWRA